MPPSASPSPGADHGLFLMLLPSDDVRMRAAALQRAIVRDMGLRHGLAGVDRLHMTMVPLGMHHAVPPGLVQRVDLAVLSVDAAPFDLVLDRVDGWNGRGAALFSRRPEHRSAVCRYQRALEDGLRGVGLARSRRQRFDPHMTLVYGEHRVPPGVPEPIAWHVEALALVLSLYGQSRHEVLARWPLRSRQMRLF